MTEYHVTFSEKKDRWQVEWGNRNMSYPGWDKHVAISGAKEMAKQTKPSKVVIHDRKGNVQKEIPYEPK
jgi:hypothetical protein